MCILTDMSVSEGPKETIERASNIALALGVELCHAQRITT